MLTSALRSGGLSTTSVAEATPSRSPGVSSTAFRAQSPNLRFASLMDMDFAVSCPLVRRWRLVSGFCSSTHTFVPCFLQTPPRGGGPCIITRPYLHQVGQRTFTSKLLSMPSTRLSRWRGGRYRVVNQESSGTTDIVWVIGKGDSCDPFTQDDAGGTPASRLFCHHHTQLLAGGDRVRQVFRQVSRQARPQRTSNLSSLSADRAQTDARHGGQPGSGAAVLFRQDAQAPSVSRVLALPPGPAPAADGAEPGGSLAVDQWRRKPVSTDVADDTLRNRHATRRTRASQGRRRR